MLKIAGTAAANTNVLNGTKMQTLYKPGYMEIRAVSIASDAAAPTVTCDFSSAETVLASKAWVRAQRSGDTGATTNAFGPGPDHVVWAGMVPAGQLILEFSAAAYWEATLR